MRPFPARVWITRSAGYERNMSQRATAGSAAASRWTRAFGEHSPAPELVALGWVKPGHAVLDVASASSETALTAARTAGPEGRVLVVDVTGAVGDPFVHRITQSGVGNVELALGDLKKLDLRRHSFDVALSSFGLATVDDPGSLVREVKDVLIPGGRLATAVWSTPEFVPLAQVALDAVGIDPPEEVFALSAREALVGLLTSAGFDGIVTTTADVVSEFSDAEAYADFAVEALPPIATMAEGGEATRDALRGAIADAARHHVDGDIVRFRNETLLAVAVA